MDLTLGAIQTCLTRMYDEAKLAYANREDLRKLVERVQNIVRPCITKLQTLQTVQSESVHPAVHALLMSVKSVEQNVSKWGQRPGWISLVFNILMRRASKIQAEIQGAVESVNKTQNDLAVALQIHAVDGIERLQQQLGNLQVQPQQGGMQFRWEIRLSELKFKTNKRGKPIEELGSGGFGTVFLAKFDGLEVAVKEPHSSKHIHKTEAIKAAFFSEANLLYKLSHLNVVAFIGAVLLDEEGHPCYMLVTERLVRTLHEAVLEGFLQSDAAKVGVCSGVASGLAYLHSMRVIHRDVKPQNIMLDHASTVKIIDFGLSKEKEDLQRSGHTTVMAGTEAWMAPEKRAGLPSSPASDVFSFGRVAAFVLLARPLDPAHPVQPLLRQAIPPSSPLHLASTLACAACAPDPALRPSAATVAAALLLSISPFTPPHAPVNPGPGLFGGFPAAAAAAAASSEPQQPHVYQQQPLVQQVPQQPQPMMQPQAAGAGGGEGWLETQFEATWMLSSKCKHCGAKKKHHHGEGRFCDANAAKVAEAMKQLQHRFPRLDPSKVNETVKGERAGFGPLHLCAWNNWPTEAIALIHLNANVNAQTKDVNGNTPLHYSASNNSVEVARLLVGNGAPVDAKDKNGNTPLHYSASNNSVEVAWLLVDNGAPVDAKDKWGRTPLHETAHWNSLQVATLLLGKGAAVNAVDKDGYTLMDYAKMMNHTEMMALLARHGGELKKRK